MDNGTLAAERDSAELKAAQSPASAAARAAEPPRKHRSKWRTWYLKQLHSWHWISAAISMVGMMLFAATGITLNHAASINATPKVTEGVAKLPAPLIAQLQGDHAADAPLPGPVAAHVETLLDLDPRGKTGEWTDEEVYVAMPGPGRDAWVSIDRATGEITTERTDRGWVSYLNDLHKGRNTGSAWFWFIDIFAAACVIFTITGLLLLQLHAKNRPTTWPIVGLGFAIPVVIAILFIH